MSGKTLKIKEGWKKILNGLRIPPYTSRDSTNAAAVMVLWEWKELSVWFYIPALTQVEQEVCLGGFYLITGGAFQKTSIFMNSLLLKVRNTGFAHIDVGEKCKMKGEKDGCCHKRCRFSCWLSRDLRSPKRRTHLRSILLSWSCREESGRQIIFFITQNITNLFNFHRLSHICKWHLRYYDQPHTT